MDSYIDTIVSEKHTVSIFRTSALKTNNVHFSETLVSWLRRAISDIFTATRTQISQTVIRI
jgi:hypothetical protein